MRVTVSDCMELDAFRDARIVAGEYNLLNEVKSISVIESYEPNDLELSSIKKAEILMTGFLSVKNDIAKQVVLIEEAVKKGCAAVLVFYVGRGIQSIDREVIGVAKQNSLPLIQMSLSANYAQTITEVMDKVLYGDNFENTLINNTVFHLLNFEKHSNFQSAAREAAINNDFQLIILSEDFNPILTVETRHKTTIEEAIKLGKKRNVESNAKSYTMIDVNGVLTYWGPVTINNEKYYMFIVDNDDSYAAGEITKLAEIIELAMGMWKYTPERDAKAEFIKALMRGNKSLAYTLKDEARINGEDILSIFSIKGANSDITTQLLGELEKAEDLSIIKITEDDETYGMILTYEENPDTDLKNNCTRFFERLKANENMVILHITGVDGIEGAGDAYRLISESGSFIRSVFPFKRVFTKYELTLVNNCINIQIQGGFVKKNYISLLDPFKAINDNKKKQLLKTLETFVLDAGMSNNKTAEVLGIHSNTVQYRLKKINEMLGAEITGNRIIPGLTIALALKRLERIVN